MILPYFANVECLKLSLFILFFPSLHVCGTPSAFRPPLKFVVLAQAGIYEYNPLPLEA